MKVKSAIKRICGFCQIIRRGKILYVRCQKNNRHKQRQGFSTLDNRFRLGDKNHCTCPPLAVYDLNKMELNIPMQKTCSHKTANKDSIDTILDQMNNKLI
jgi:ribosomal protein L36